MAGKNQPFTPKSGVVVAAERIAEMDAQGVDVEALSVNPFWYDAERVFADVRRAALELRLEALNTTLEARFALGLEDLP